MASMHEFIEVPGNTVTTKSKESENDSNEEVIYGQKEDFDKSNDAEQLREADNSKSAQNDLGALDQLTKANHDQFNLIKKLQKDLEYWQQKCIKLKIDSESAKFDLKKSSKLKGSKLRENKELKEKVDELQQKVGEQDATISDLTHKYEEAKAENEKLTEAVSVQESSSTDVDKVEQEV